LAQAVQMLAAQTIVRIISYSGNRTAESSEIMTRKISTMNEMKSSSGGMGGVAGTMRSKVQAGPCQHADKNIVQTPSRCRQQKGNKAAEHTVRNERRVRNAHDEQDEEQQRCDEHRVWSRPPYLSWGQDEHQRQECNSPSEQQFDQISHAAAFVWA
jgi:hypothetical protein